MTWRLLSIYEETGTRFVFIIDEWDCDFRIHRRDTEAQKAYLDFLRNLFKDKPYIALALYAARDHYTIIRELPAGKGFADMAFIPRPNQADIPALLVELKWDQDVSTAIDQIRARDYPQALAAYAGNILLVGITYDKDSKEHGCTIEQA